LAATGAVIFWLAVGLIQKFNWESGAAKALVLLALLAALPFIAAAAERRGDDRRAVPRRLVAASIVLLALQIVYALWQLRHPSLTDIATTTLAAGDTLRAGGNPYATSFDASASGAAARFAGYKYLPVMIAAYLPLGAPLAERGVVLTNLLLALATTGLVFGLAARLAGARAAWLATLLYLSLPLVPFQLFAKGVTDLVAVAPLLLALLVLEHRPALAGLCVGLSIAAKLLPGALLLPCCLRGARPAAGAAVPAVVAQRLHRQHRPLQPGATRRQHQLAFPRAGVPRRLGACRRRRGARRRRGLCMAATALTCPTHGAGGDAHAAGPADRPHRASQLSALVAPLLRGAPRRRRSIEGAGGRRRIGG
jgi:Glycosyltransferase family 87